MKVFPFFKAYKSFSKLQFQLCTDFVVLPVVSPAFLPQYNSTHISEVFCNLVAYLEKGTAGVGDGRSARHSQLSGRLAGLPQCFLELLP